MSLTSSTKAPVDHVQTPEEDGIVRSRPGKATKEERRILHRVDRRLIVMLGLLHTVSLIDRGNLGTASVAGMTKQLHLIGMRYVRSVPSGCSPMIRGEGRD